MRFNSVSNRLVFFVLAFIVIFGSLVEAKKLGQFSYKNSCNESLNSGRSLTSTEDVFEEIYKVLPAKVWPVGAIENVTFMELNFLNLISRKLAENMRDGKKLAKSGYHEFAKPLFQLQGVARLIKKHKPMFLLGIEIETLKILQDFDSEFVNDQYEELLIEGNDSRGIDVALLVRKDLPLEIKAQSHKNLVDSTSGELVFSRDLPAYSIYEKGNSDPLLTIFGTHFKSQRDSDGDPRSVKKRTLQVLAASLIIADYEKQFPNVPVLISGDFNNDVRTAKEFESLKEIGLKDAFDISTGETVPKQNRGTHFYFSGNGEATVSQLDASFFNKVAILQKIVKSAQILSFINENGDEYPVPHTYKERERLPSDHRATLLVLDLSKKGHLSKKQKAN